MTNLSCFCQKSELNSKKIGVFRWYFGDSSDPNQLIQGCTLGFSPVTVQIKTATYSVVNQYFIKVAINCYLAKCSAAN